MYTTENLPHPTPLVDYIPAELRENKTWEVVFYALDPATQKLKIKRHRVKKLKSVQERRNHGKRMVHEINRRLMRGWNPFLSKSEKKGFVKLKSAIDTYLSRVKKQVSNDSLRPDTLRAYTSYLKNLMVYLSENGYGDIFCIKFNESMARGFLDHIYYERDNSARTRNNYLKFLNTFCDWLIKHEYLSTNPTSKIDTVKESKKKRVIIPDDQLKIIFGHLRTNDTGFLVCCMVCYYCLVRRTEISKLKVGDILIKNAIIHIPGSISKNKKSMPVTIPDKLLPILAEHISKAAVEDYLFSRNFVPGTDQLDPKRISDKWARMRKRLKMPSEYQWYSLKDTGITNLLKAGVPLIAVRNQARHHSSDQTDAYTPRDILVANDRIRTVNI